MLILKFCALCTVKGPALFERRAGPFTVHIDGSFAPLSNHVLCPKCEHRCPSPQGFVWFLVFSLENKCSHTGMSTFPKPRESTWSTKDDPSVGPLRHHLNELWHYSQFCMSQAFVLFMWNVSMLWICLLKQHISSCVFKNPHCDSCRCFSLKVIIIHSPASEETNRGAESSNYMFIMDQRTHRHIPQFYFKACLETFSCCLLWTS